MITRDHLRRVIRMRERYGQRISDWEPMPSDHPSVAYVPPAQPTHHAVVRMPQGRPWHGDLSFDVASSLFYGHLHHGKQTADVEAYLTLNRDPGAKLILADGRSAVAFLGELTGSLDASLSGVLRGSVRSGVDWGGYRVGERRLIQKFDRLSQEPAQPYELELRAIPK